MSHDTVRTRTRLPHYYINHTIHNLVVLLLAMAVATKTFCSKTRGEEAFLCSRIWVMNREKVRWNTLVSELKKGRLFYNFCFAEKGFLLSHSDGIISIGKRPLGVAKRKKRNEKFKVDINWDAQNRKKAVCWRPPRRPIQKMRKCYCTLLLSEIDNILDPKQAVSLYVPREFDFRKNACACMHYIDCKSNIYILLHRIIFYDFQSEKLQGKMKEKPLCKIPFMW